MRRRLVVCLVCALVLGGCDEPDAQLVVQLRTDLVPGVEFTGVEVRLDADSETRLPEAGDDFLAGEPVATFEGVPLGQRQLELTLVSGVDRVVTRPVAVTLESSTVVTVLVGRDCRDVSCGGETSACLDGRCASPACTEETPEACPDAECGQDADCLAMDACATPRCVAGACLYEGGGCGSTEYCDPAVGCLTRPMVVTSDAGTPDAGSPPGPFISISPIGQLNTMMTEWSPGVTADGLTLVFASDRTGNYDIYLSTRGDVTEPWGPATIVSGLDTPADENEPTISADGLGIYFQASSGMRTTVHLAQRPDLSSPFEPRVDLAAGWAGLPSHGGPAVSADELTLYLSVYVGADVRLYRSIRGSTSEPWPAPGQLTIFLAQHLGFAGVTGDHRTLYFQTDATGDGNVHVFRATRQDLDDEWTSAQSVDALMSAGNDGDPQPSADDCDVYFASDRAGTWDLYVASRDCR